MAERSQEVLELGPVPLLAWLPGETLFSLCSRQHGFWGHRHAWSTASLLFGGRHAGTQHDLPNQLDEFAERTHDALGTADEVAERRTLLRYYRPFLSPSELGEAIVAMRSKSVAHLKFKLGLLTSRFRANHPLKACPACIEDDTNEYGWAYWHLKHQYPGVWVCLRHRTVLLESRMKSSGVGRFLWTLPSHKDLVDEVEGLTDLSSDRLRSLAELIVELVDAEEDPGWLKAEKMLPGLLVAVAERGWRTANGNLRLKPMAADFLNYCQELKSLREFAGLPQTIDEAELQLGRLLRPLRSGTHPLRLLTIAHWLIGGASALRELVIQCGNRLTIIEPEAAKRTHASAHNDAKRREIVSRVRNGEALSTIARRIGIDVTTAKAWAAQAGIASPRRASVIKPSILVSLKADLGSGIDKGQAASRHGISISSVNRVLRTEVGLAHEWRTARETSARSKARGAWEELLVLHGHQGSKFMRTADPAVYAWLYRNDLSWLRDHSPPRLPASPASPTSRLAWDERDHVLKAAVDIAVLELWQSIGDRPLHLWQIYQRIPELKAKLTHLNRMPLTSSALELALARSERRRSDK
ncbi:MAG: TnsD family Tn7-like transposition protein [Nevskia sp.]|nr:TnsD family Tn7-like transposition protein [Nevskia sp.]